jgi:hypothetical protein
MQASATLLRPLKLTALSDLVGSDQSATAWKHGYGCGRGWHGCDYGYGVMDESLKMHKKHVNGIVNPQTSTLISLNHQISLLYLDLGIVGACDWHL